MAVVQTRKTLLFVEFPCGRRRPEVSVPYLELLQLHYNSECHVEDLILSFIYN